MSEINDSTLCAVDEMLVRRYSIRLGEFGDDPKTLGWDTRENQLARFNIAVESVDFSGRSVLDVGCGLADFRFFLNSKNVLLKSYAGCDINPDLLKNCRVRMPNDIFHQVNIANHDVENAPYDIVTLFGILNFRFAEFDNFDFARKMIRRAFDHCSEVLVVDFLSTIKEACYPSEEFVFYYEPTEILKFAFSITPHVTLRHDYRSLPQREMMLILRKSPCV